MLNEFFNGSTGGYKIERSLIFSADSTSYLSRTPSAVGNRFKWTFSCWAKRGVLGSNRPMFAVRPSSNDRFHLRFGSSDVIEIREVSGGGTLYLLESVEVFRDPSAWYHVVAAFDSTQAVASDRIKVYVNGSELTLTASTAIPQDTESIVGDNKITFIGKNSSNYYDGSLAEVHFIDGQRLTATDFAELDDNGIWQPKRYQGGYGVDYSNYATNPGSYTGSVLNLFDGDTATGWENTHASDYATVDLTQGGATSGLSFSTSFEIGGIFGDNHTLEIDHAGGTYTYSGNPGTVFAYLNLGAAVTSPITEIRFKKIDGNAGAPKWTAIRVDGYIFTSGLNSYHLEFLDTSGTTSGSNTGIGKDTSGNGNYFDSFNISVTTGSDSDTSVDTPTNYIASSGNNGGNYATLNPLATSTTIATANANLGVVATSSARGSSLATIAIGGSGKYYFECYLDSDKNAATGIAPVEDADQIGSNTRFGFNAEGHALRMDTALYQANSGAISVSYTFTPVIGDTIGCLINLDDNEISWSQNGTVGTVYSIQANTTWLPFSGCFNGGGATNHTLNFGQKPFDYLPTGYQSICTTNLDDPTIADGSTAMDVLTWNGDGSSTGSVSGLSFSPDLIWHKRRDLNSHNLLYDVIRGPSDGSTSNSLSSNLTNAEGSTNDNSTYGYLSGFDSNGFSWTKGSTGEYFGVSGASHVDWAWDAGTSTVSNTDGSITSSVRANPSAGFSIVTYSGNNSTSGSVGHGLNASPSMVVIKERHGTKNWKVAHTSLASTHMLTLNENYATGAASWNGVTSSVFYPARSGDTYNNTSGENYIAYCFAPVEGYSAFGSVDANGTTDNAFIYLGFRAKFVIFKRSNGTGNWVMWDTSRNTYNVMDKYLFSNTSNAEGTDSQFDILSNGIKIRTAGFASGGTYIYAAFAEHPFKTARAR